MPNFVVQFAMEPLLNNSTAKGIEGRESAYTANGTLFY